MISTSLDPFCSVLCLFLWSLQWFRYVDYPALVTCIFKTPFAICKWKWKYLLHYIWLQILFPLGKLSVMIYGCLASIIFCGYIVYDTDNLIKRYSYDEYIWAAVSLYLDIINLFLSLLTIFRAADSWEIHVYSYMFWNISVW